jgi:plastocyanin
MNVRPAWTLVVLTASVVAGPGASRALAQPLTYRTPNLGGTWITSPWNLNFAFNHRFRVIGDDADIGDIVDEGVVDNAPTFDLSLGLWSPLMAGVKYGTKPAIINGNRTNEWFPYIKLAPVRDPTWSLSFLGGYNTQAESADGEVAAQLAVGRFEFLGAARGFSDALHTGEAGLALAGGVGFHLTNYLTLAADLGGLVAGPDTTAAWSAGLQIAIPYTPHTFSLQVSNSAGTTLQEASFGGIEVGGGTLTWGFEFTVPFSGFARWGAIFDRKRPEEASPAGAVGPARVVEVEIRDFRFGPDTIRVEVGSVVRWVNRDPVGHTSTADGGAWGSPLIGPGETYTARLEVEGTFAYHCIPHPFMRGAIIVEPRRQSGEP